MFDRVAILDWSASGKPKKGRDSIWVGITSETGTQTQNIATRLDAETRLCELIDDCLKTNTRLLLGVDFALSAPPGFTERLTGTNDPFALWNYLRGRIIEGPDNFTNYREVAAEMNAAFDGDGPFWGNTQKADVTGLPRKKPPLPSGLSVYRLTEIIARHFGAMPKTLWQLAGAGAVGAQSLTGMAMLARLRAMYPMLKVWPFEPLGPVTLAEVYPSLIAPEVKVAKTLGSVTDEVQVSLLSKSFFNLAATGRFETLLQDPPPDGAILGAGKADILSSALPKYISAPKTVSPNAPLDLASALDFVAGLGCPPPLETIMAKNASGRILEQPLSLGGTVFDAGKRIRPIDIPLISQANVEKVSVHKVLNLCISGICSEGTSASMHKILETESIKLSETSEFPQGANRIKARLTVLTADCDLLACKMSPDSTLQSVLAAEGELVRIPLVYADLPHFHVARWKNTLVLCGPDTFEACVFIMTLILKPLARKLTGETGFALGQQRANLAAPVEGPRLVLCSVEQNSATPVQDQTTAQGLADANAIAIVPGARDAGDEISIVHFQDLGLL